MPRISILMPARNAMDTLPAAIESIEEQSFGDFEVVAVDDGSDDETFGLLYTWAQRDGRVRVLQGHGRGLVAALGTGLAAARADLVARMDADDIADRSRLERQVSLIDRRHDIAACGTRVEYFPPDEVQDGARRYQDWINELIEPDEIARDIFVECPIPHPTLLIRRSALLAVGGYRDMGWPEDYDLILRLWAAGYRMAKVPDVLLQWRESEDRHSRVDPCYSADAFRRCKVHFLRRTLLAGREGVIVWGAGPTGKRFAQELKRQGARLLAFVDLDPRKIGQEIHGISVLSPDDLDSHWAAFAVLAVGQPGARAEIRAALRQHGWTEMQDYVAVA